MDRIQDMGQKKALLRGFGLDEALANLTGPERKAALADIKQNIGKLSDEARKKGLEAAAGFDKLRESIEHLRTEVGANLAGDVAKATTAIAEFISGKGPELVETLRHMAEGAKDFVKGAGLMGEALDSLRKQDPVDLTKLIDFANFDKTAEVFMQTWKARWLGFKSTFGGDQGAADAAEVERRRLLKKDFPEEFEREEKARRDEQGKGLQGGLPFSGRWPVPQIEPERIMPPGDFGTRPMWKRLFDMTDKGGGSIVPAAYRVGGPNPLLGGGGAAAGFGERMFEGAVERGSRKGIYDGLWDFVRGQPGGAGGGGAAGAGMRAIRANYSPGGEGGLGGAGAGTGEPSAEGGAGVAAPGGGFRVPPMGRLPGYDEATGGGTTREFHPPTIPPGQGPAVADQLKGAGVDLPPALDAKIRGGGQVSEGDLKALPPAQLEKANKAVTGAGQPPLFTDKPSGGGGGGKPVGVEQLGGGGAPGAMRLMRDLATKGWSPEAAAMMAGNVKAESNFKTGSVGDGGTSFGLAQWHGERARALKAHAAAQGKDWRDWDTQTDFLDKEFRGRFGDKAVASHDVDALSRQGKAFEGYSTNTFGQRVGNARKFLQDYNAGGGTGGGKPPHFGLADIRKSLEGTAINPGGVSGGIDRSQFQSEIDQNPALVTKMASMVQGEVGANAPLKARTVQLETAFNRAQARGHSLSQALLSVAEDPKRGYYARDTYHPVSKEDVAKFKRDVLAPVMAGSNQSDVGYGPMTGNASGSVAAHQFARGTPGYKLPGGDTYFREGPFTHPFPRLPTTPTETAALHGEALRKHFGHPGKMPNVGAAIGGSGTQEQRKRDSFAQYRNRASDYFHEHNDVVGGMNIPKSMRGLSDYDRLKNEEKNMELRGVVTPGGPAERPFKPSREQDARYDLLGHAREAGLIGQPQEHKVSGSAALDIHVYGPAGTQARTRKMEGLFKEIKIARGRAAPLAHQDG
jgi:Phage tail lysozyme